MPSLFGITNSNRDSEDFWTKNCFNSSFPAALANYMLSRDIPVNYITIDQDLQPRVTTLSVRELYNMDADTDLNQLYFSFESRYDPYRAYAYENIDGIDLVIKKMNGDFLRPLEVKLTVIPDSTTCNNPDESLWGSEIVIRSATTQYCTLGMTHSLVDHLDDIRDLFEGPCSRIQDWANKTEMRARLPRLLEICDTFEHQYYQHQKPLIMQPIWKTQGQSPLLSEDGAFDIFVWSDFAFTRLFLTAPLLDIEADKPLSRHNRAAARFIRYWYEVARNGRVHLRDIYRQMTYDLQTDKEFSISGNATNPYMRCDRLTTPIVTREALYDIIIDGGENLLMPERRLDQSVLYYTMRNPRPTTEE